MSQNIVRKYPASGLQVYVVWVNQRVTDGRDEISVATVPGARHYWDDVPEPILASGSPVDYESDRLADAAERVLG